MKQLPTAFKRHVEAELADHGFARLTVAHVPCTKWDVDIVQEGGELYFKDGWNLFVTDNQLGDYNFLEFKYSAGLNFHVHIYDRSAVARMPYTGGPAWRCQLRTDVNALDEDPASDVELAVDGQVEAPARDDQGGQQQADPDAFFTVYVGHNPPTIPVHFFTSHIKDVRAQLVLDGPVHGGMVVHTFKNNCSVRLGSGWGKFRTLNQVRRGDRLHFELTARNMFRVTKLETPPSE